MGGRNRSSRGVAALVVVLGVFTVGGSAAPARADTAHAPIKRDAAEEEAYARDLKTIDPRLADTFREATAALDAGRLPEARKGFEEIVARVPTHAATLRRLSYVLREAGEIDPAIEVARRARKAGPGPFGDYALAAALLGKKGDPAALEEAGMLAEKLLEGEPD